MESLLEEKSSREPVKVRRGKERKFEMRGETVGHIKGTLITAAEKLKPRQGGRLFSARKQFDTKSEMEREGRDKRERLLSLPILDMLLTGNDGQVVAWDEEKRRTRAPITLSQKKKKREEREEHSFRNHITNQSKPSQKAFQRIHPRKK